MKSNIFKYGLFGAIIFLTTFTEITTAESTHVKVIATIVDGTSELIEKIEENIYEGIIENNHDHDIIFTSNSDIKSFPKQAILKPGEKQVFKFIAKDKSSISLTYELNNRCINVKTYNDLYSKN